MIVHSETQKSVNKKKLDFKLLFKSLFSVAFVNKTGEVLNCVNNFYLL